MAWLPGILLSAVLTFFSFPPFPLGGIMLVGLVPVFLAMETAPTWKAAAFRTWVYVFVGNAAICIWVAYAVREFAGLPPWLSYGTVLGLSAFEQLAWPVMAGLRHWLSRRYGVRPIFWTPAALVALEALWPKVFPNTMGYAFYRFPWMVQAADVAGIAGVTFVCVAVNEAVAMALLEKSRAGRRRVLAPAAALLVVTLVYGAWRLHDVRSTMARPDRTLKTALIQPNVNSLQKVRAEADRDMARLEVIAHLLKLTATAQEQRPELIVWPETAFPAGYSPPGEGRSITARGAGAPDWGQALEEAVQATEARLLFGAPLVEPQGRYNGFILMTPGEEAPQVQLYRKSILLELGEYIPILGRLPAVSEWFRRHGGSAYLHGPGATTFRLTQDVALGPMICLEGLYPRYVRRIAGLGADILVNATNDAWFGPGMEPALHLHLTAIRSIETRRPLVRATNTGYTAVVDIDGSFRARTQLDEERIVVDEVPVYRSVQSPYLALGDLPLWLAGLWALLGAWLGVARPRNRIE